VVWARSGRREIIIKCLIVLPFFQARQMARRRGAPETRVSRNAGSSRACGEGGKFLAFFRQHRLPDRGENIRNQGEYGGQTHRCGLGLAGQRTDTP
jgi:hypothetical protein